MLLHCITTFEPFSTKLDHVTSYIVLMRSVFAEDFLYLCVERNQYNVMSTSLLKVPPSEWTWPGLVLKGSKVVIQCNNIATDGVSEAGNAIGSVRPSVRLFPL